MPWVFNLAHTQVFWSNHYLGIMDIRGLFSKVAVSLEFAGDDLASGSLRAAIDTASIESGLPARDDVLRNADWLDVEHHPQMTFVSRSITRQGDGWQMVGDLTLKGHTHAVAMSLNYQGEATNRRGERARIVTSELTLDRTRFGVGPAETSVFAADVSIMLQIEAVWRDE